MRTVCLLLLLCLACFAKFDDGKKYTAHYDSKTNQWSIAKGEDGVAWAELKNKTFETGWLTLDVVSSNKYADALQAYAAGYLEGALTNEAIWNNYQSYIQSSNLVNPSAALTTFITNNMKFIQASIANPPSQQAQYWDQVNLVLEQTYGMLQGYNQQAPTDRQLTLQNLLLLQLAWEYGDILAASSSIEEASEMAPNFNNLHCSVIIKPDPTNSELFATHVTWTSFSWMLRIFKHFTLNFKNVAATTVSFSSFPGTIASGDDYYLTSANLMVTETTNEILNSTLYHTYVTPETVPYWIRVMVANRLASSGQEWSEVFGEYNSGTYNNQWIIVNYNLFTPGATLQPGTLWIGEQIPGYFVNGDQTSVLIKQGYWASYNIPFYPFIYTISGYPAYYQKYGNAYSYSECARAQIFRRDQANATDMHSIKALMRYNNYQNDPLALQDACRGISARCDLNTPWVKNSLNGAVAFGAIDAKLTTNKHIKKLETKAISGPTWDSQPPFAWTNQWANVPHYGQPKVFAFDFVDMVPMGW